MKSARYFCPISTKFGFFQYKSSVSNFTEIRPVGAAPIHADRRTGAVGACRDWTNASKNASENRGRLLKLKSVTRN